MKLFTAIAAAAVLGISLITATPSEARNGWLKVGCGSMSHGKGCHYYRVLKRNPPFVTVESKSTFPYNGPRYLALHKEIDCNGWRIRTRWQWADSGWDSWDQWEDILPGTINDGGASAVC